MYKLEVLGCHLARICFLLILFRLFSSLYIVRDRLTKAWMIHRNLKN
jgi:hypothetical protein